MKLNAPLFLRHDGMRLGWPGSLGMCGVALGVAFAVAIVVPARQRAEAARLSVAAMQGQPAAGASKRDKVLSPGEQLAAFYAFFPSELDAPDAIGKIVAIARRHGLSLQQAEYKAERDKTGKLTRLQMSLPFRAAYAPIRQFLSTLRTEMPAVALEQVQFERQKVGDAVIDAKLRLVIFLRAAP
jgi:hypothetical protein